MVKRRAFLLISADFLLIFPNFFEFLPFFPAGAFLLFGRMRIFGLKFKEGLTVFETDNEAVVKAKTKIIRILKANT